MKRSSTSYIFTADPLCCDSMQQINLVKSTLKKINALAVAGYSHGGDYGKKCWRIKLHGRLGKNNPAAAKYRNQHQWQTIALGDAQRIDVYVYPEFRVLKTPTPNF